MVFALASCSQQVGRVKPQPKSQNEIDIDALTQQVREGELEDAYLAGKGQMLCEMLSSCPHLDSYKELREWVDAQDLKAGRHAVEAPRTRRAIVK